MRKANSVNSFILKFQYLFFLIYVSLHSPSQFYSSYKIGFPSGVGQLAKNYSQAELLVIKMDKRLSL